MRKNANPKYNANYFKSIMKMAEEYRLNDAINEFEKYVTMYPHDASGYTYYADTLIKADRLEEAENILIHAESLLGIGDYNLDIQNFIMIKIKLLICQKKYKECYDFLKNNYENIHLRIYLSGISTILAFLKKKLNILTDSDKNFDNYHLQQIISYSTKRALEHIALHQLENNESRFKSDFSLQETYYKIRELLPNENKYIKSGITESYIFKYGANGYVDNKVVDYIEVITIQDSNEIIAMYSYENSERRRYIDITPTIDDDVKLQRKSPKSQIDKFNERYGNIIDKH